MKLTLILCLLGLWQNSYAGELSVIDVRRNITLSDEDTVYKDFYLSGGTETGLKRNMVVTAVRKLNIRDASGANSFGEIQVPVGQLKIIAVYDKIAVAREFTLLSRDELPMLEQIGIMNGDRIDIKGSFMDTSKPKKRKVSEMSPVDNSLTAATTVSLTPAPPQTPAPVAVTAPAPLPTTAATTTTTPPALTNPQVASAATAAEP
ncbi:hypothetical protein D3C87_1153070 [compost metagenome]